jgi:hypothetical protein
MNPACTTYTLACLVSKIIQYLEIGIMLIISLAVVSFIWNVYRYFFKADVENKAEAGLYVMYSTIGFFIILSFWGLVAILANTLNLPNAQPMWLFGGGSGTPSSNLFHTTNPGATSGSNIYRTTNPGSNIYNTSNTGSNTYNTSNSSGANGTTYSGTGGTAPAVDPAFDFQSFNPSD